jgi:hypothetical protein
MGARVAAIEDYLVPPRRISKKRNYYAHDEWTYDFRTTPDPTGVVHAALAMSDSLRLSYTNRT